MIYPELRLWRSPESESLPAIESCIANAQESFPSFMRANNLHVTIATVVLDEQYFRDSTYKKSILNHCAGVGNKVWVAPLKPELRLLGHRLGLVSLALEIGESAELAQTMNFTKDLKPIRRQRRGTKDVVHLTIGTVKSIDLCTKKLDSLACTSPNSIILSKIEVYSKDEAMCKQMRELIRMKVPLTKTQTPEDIEVKDPIILPTPQLYRPNSIPDAFLSSLRSQVSLNRNISSV